jgi:hypothetical protein
MLGFMDCLYSCVWSSFKADELAENYANTINNLVKEYPDLNIYACTVAPVNGDYPFAEGNNGLVTKDELTERKFIFFPG